MNRLRAIAASSVRRPLVSIGVGFLVMGLGGSVFHGLLSALGTSMVLMTCAAFIQGSPR